MNVYEFVSIFLVPFVLIKFIINFLSDNTITHSELKIGIHILLHHIAASVCFLGSVMALVLLNDLKYSIFVILIFMGTQVGFLINNDRCWYTKYTNMLADPERPDKRWVSSFFEFIKYYLRGDEWANGDMRDTNFTTGVTFINMVLILILLKFIISKNKTI